MRDKLSRRFIQVSEGISLHSWHRTGSDPAIVMIHGLGDAGSVWHTTISALAVGNQVVAIDLPGHGHSSWLHPPNYTHAALTQLVSRQLSSLELHNLVLVGHSLGASIALKLAGDRRWNAMSIIAVDYSWKIPKFFREDFAQRLNRRRDQFSSRDDFCVEITKAIPNVSSKAVDILWDSMAPDGRGRRIERLPDPRVISCLDDLNEPYQSLCLPQRLELLRGEYSSFLSRDAAKAILRQLGGGNLKEIAKAGHAIPLERPEILAEQIALIATALSAT